MRITLLLLLTFFSITLFSQQDSLLKKFKYRIDHYQAINFNIGGSGQYNNTDYASGKNESNSSGGNLGANYSFLKSTDRILLNLAVGAYSYASFGSNENQFSKVKNSSFYGSPYLYVQNKWFGKKIFTELGANITTGFSGNKNTTKNSAQDNESKNKQTQYSITVTAGIGKGRLENITDMQNALWLYKALQDENKLSHSLTDDELNNLGRSITKANNTRVLDSRRRTQFMLETVDSFLQTTNAIAANDIRYFSTLNDILFFAFNNQRLSGTELFFRVTPSAGKDNQDQTNQFPSTNSENKSLTKAIQASAGINKYVPANLKHQNNYGFSVKANWINWDYSDKYFVSGNPVTIQEINSTLKQAGVTAFFQHAVYPNTRTIISFDLSGETGYQDLEGENSFFGQANVSATLNYFISYRTRLTGGIGVMYRNNIYQAIYDLTLLPNSFSLNGNIGLQVSL